MVKIAELKELYEATKYREVIVALNKEVLDPVVMDDAEKLLQVAWAHHQLGEYKESLKIFEELLMRYANRKSMGEREIYTSAARGVVHGLLQTGSDDFARIDFIVQGLPSSLAFDNVYMNAAIARARKSKVISVSLVMDRILAALDTVPYKTVNGHVINNGVLALYEAKKNQNVPYVSILPGLIFAAIKIYTDTNTAKNHLASATFRASQICEAAGWNKFAQVEAETSVRLWRELVDSQDGARYQKNLEGAETQLKKVTQ